MKHFHIEGFVHSLALLGIRLDDRNVDALLAELLSQVASNLTRSYNDPFHFRLDYQVQMG